MGLLALLALDSVRCDSTNEEVSEHTILSLEPVSSHLMLLCLG